MIHRPETAFKKATKLITVCGNEHLNFNIDVYVQLDIHMYYNVCKVEGLTFPTNNCKKLSFHPD